MCSQSGGQKLSELLLEERPSGYSNQMGLSPWEHEWNNNLSWPWYFEMSWHLEGKKKNSSTWEKMEYWTILLGQWISMPNFMSTQEIWPVAAEALDHKLRFGGLKRTFWQQPKRKISRQPYLQTETDQWLPPKSKRTNRKRQSQTTSVSGLAYSTKTQKSALFQTGPLMTIKYSTKTI